MQLVVDSLGAIRCVYGEAIDLHALGMLSISRGSYVEPDSLGNWGADLSPVQGPILGPFPYRTDAVTAEHKWLEEHLV